MCYITSTSEKCDVISVYPQVLAGQLITWSAVLVVHVRESHKTAFVMLSVIPCKIAAEMLLKYALHQVCYIVEYCTMNLSCHGRPSWLPWEAHLHKLFEHWLVIGWDCCTLDFQCTACPCMVTLKLSTYSTNFMVECEVLLTIQSIWDWRSPENECSVYWSNHWEVDLGTLEPLLLGNLDISTFCFIDGF